MRRARGPFRRASRLTAPFSSGVRATRRSAAVAGRFFPAVAWSVAGLLAAGLLGGVAPAATSQRQSGAVAGTIHVRFNLDRLELNLGLVVSLTPVDDPNIVIDSSPDSSEALGKLLC